MSRLAGGWYRDPDGPGWRFWDGTQWTWSTRPEDARGRSARRALEAKAFVAEARAAGLIDQDTGIVLRRFAERWGAGQLPPPTAEAPAAFEPASIGDPMLRPKLIPPVAPTAHGLPPVPPANAPPSWALTSPPVAAPPPETAPAAARPAEVSLPLRPLPPPAARPVRIEPSPPVQPPVPPTRTWTDRAREAVLSDLSVHGLAYLGVLLLFAGVAGFLLFAFGDVSRSWRPLAELLVPVALFAAAWVLGRRGSTVVSQALTFTGGALLPIVAIATLVDGAPVPRDPHTYVLVTAATAVPLVIAIAYAVIGTRRPSSPLRYLAAPTLWVAVAMAALLPRAHELTGWVGGHIATPTGVGQAAAVLVAVAATAVATRLRPQHPLSTPSQLAALVGLPLVLALALLVGARDGWPLAPVLVGAAAVVVALEALAPRLPVEVVAVGQPLAVVAPLAVPLAMTPRGWLAVALTVASLALLEWQARTRPTEVALGCAAVAAAVAITVAAADPWSWLAALGIALVWSAARAARPLAAVPSEVALAVVAVLPFAIAADLYRLLDPQPATLVCAAAVLAVAVALRLVPATRRSPWQWWTIGAAVAVGTAAVVVAGDEPPSWALVASAALAAAAVVLTTTPVAARVWLAAAGCFEAGALALVVLDAPLTTAAVAVGVTGLVLAQAGWLRAPAAPHLAAMGLATGIVAVAMAIGPQHPALDVTIALAVATWLLAAVAAETGHWVLGPLLVAAVKLDTFTDAAVVPEAVTIAGLPLLALVVLDGFDLLDTSTVPAGLALAALGLLAAAGTRLVPSRRGLVWLLAAAGVTEVAVAVPLAWAEPAATLLTSAVVVLAIAALHPSVRPEPSWWLAWVASGTAAVAVGQLAGVPDDRMALVVVAWGSVLVIGALAADLALAGWRRAPGWIRTSWLHAPVDLGAAGGAIAFAVVASVPDPAWTWCCLATAGVLLVVAVLTRTGAVTGAAWVVGLAGVAGLVPTDWLDTPWTFVAAGAAVLACSALLGLVPREGEPWWGRWDLPAFAVANALVLVGVVTVRTSDELVVAWAPAGALSLVVAWWKRSIVWVVAGLVLLAGAGIAAGPAWRTATFAVMAVGFLLAALRVEPAFKAPTHLASAAAVVATCWSLADWLAWSATTCAVAAALAGGVLAIALAAGFRWTPLSLATWWPWVALAGTGLTTAGALLGTADRQPAGLALAAGLGLTSLGIGMTATPLDTDELRPAAVVTGAGAAGVAGWALAITPSQIVAAGLVVAFAAVVVGLALDRARLRSPWVLPADIAAGIAAAVALGGGIAALPDRVPVTAALASLGGVLALVGVGRRRRELLALVPVAELAAWLVGAGAALRGEPVWLLLPVGVGLLVEAALVRRVIHDDRGLEAARWIELTGMAFAVVPALVSTVTDSLAWALVAAGAGVALAAWGVVTQTRRRLEAGAASVVLAVALVVLIPLSDILPRAGAGALFLALAGAGLVAIILATFLESGRARVGHAVDHLKDLTRGWS